MAGFWCDRIRPVLLEIHVFAVFGGFSPCSKGKSILVSSLLSLKGGRFEILKIPLKSTNKSRCVFAFHTWDVNEADILFQKSGAQKGGALFLGGS